MGDRGTGLVTVPFTDDKTLHNSIQSQKSLLLPSIFWKALIPKQAHILKERDNGTYKTIFYMLQSTIVNKRHRCGEQHT